MTAEGARPKPEMLSAHPVRLLQSFDRITVARNHLDPVGVQQGMDDDEDAAIRDEGRDPSDLAVRSALDQVKRTLHLYRHLAWTFTADDLDGVAVPR